MIATSPFNTAPLGLAAALALAGALAFGAPARAADLTLSFEGVKTPTGAVLLSLWDSEEAYASGKAPVAERRLSVEGDKASGVVTGLKPGRYAVKAFHDVDGDGKMAANPFGMPTEPFAFSNNAPATMGPPGWAAAAFALGEAGGVQTIRID